VRQQEWVGLLGNLIASYVPPGNRRRPRSRRSGHYHRRQREHRVIANPPHEQPVVLAEAQVRRSHDVERSEHRVFVAKRDICRRAGCILKDRREGMPRVIVGEHQHVAALAVGLAGQACWHFG
jgi:hypothetical protein